MRLRLKAWSQLTAAESDANVMQSQTKFMAERETRAVAESCCRLRRTVSQMTGLNRGDRVRWAVRILSSAGSKGRGRGKRSFGSDREQSNVVRAKPRRKRDKMPPQLCRGWSWMADWKVVVLDFKVIIKVIIRSRTSRKSVMSHKNVEAFIVFTLKWIRISLPSLMISSCETLHNDEHACDL